MNSFGDILFNYFSNEKVPLPTKIKVSILGLLALLLIDNHYGFVHTVINSYKVDYIMKLESAKRVYKSDTAFVSHINYLMEVEQNRKGTVEKFLSLLTPKSDGNHRNRADEVYLRLISERDPVIHTVTSAFIFLIPMVSGFLAVLISLFRPNSRNIDTIFWAVLIILVSSCLTYYVSLTWALIDPICGKLWINYTIQILTNFLILVIAVTHLEAYGHKWDEKE